jgi:hypothetical protein
MRKFRFLTVAAICAVLVLPAAAGAANTTVDLNVNADDVQANIDFRINPYQTPLIIGAGFLYSDDDEEYWISNVHAAVKDEVFVPALSLGAGLKAVFGNTDFGPRDFDTSALAFQFLGDYDFRKTAANFPLSIGVGFDYAPEVLSFSDTDEYQFFYAELAFHINEYAALFAGYRDLEIDYKDGGDRDELSDDAAYFGVRFTF